jgi:phosphoserine aminotransferase
MKKYNYSAGPSILPQEVFEKSAQAILDFNNSGLSILEISHRSKDFVAVMDEARSLAIELLGLEGKGYQALFLAGGASTERKWKSCLFRFRNLGNCSNKRS